MSGPGPAYDKRDFWHGTLLENKQDKSGLSYARNRYYDPLTGRFTQEDPIGLAGGLNLYGFAGGDPVNFSDPFGLCPPCLGVDINAGILAPLADPQIGRSFIIDYIARDALHRDMDGLIMMVGNLRSEPGEIPTPEQIRGRSPQEVERMVPEGWEQSPTSGGGGTRYSNPNRPGEQIRVMPGNPKDPNPVKQAPYARISTQGKKSDPIPLQGNPTLERPDTPHDD